MLWSPALLVMALTFGLGHAQNQCISNSCYGALANYCPTTARSDCASIYSLTTVTTTLSGPSAVTISQVTETVTVTEGLGACPPGVPSSVASAAPVGAQKRQASASSSSSVATSIPAPVLPVYGQPVPTSSPPIVVPTYAARVPGCSAPAYASACSCLFGVPLRTVDVLVTAPGTTRTVIDTTTTTVITVLPNNCSSTSVLAATSSTVRNLSASQAGRLAGSVGSHSGTATPSSTQSSATACATDRAVDILTDPDHCGACNNKCAAPEGCINGVCTTPTCAGATCGSFTPCGTSPPNGGCSCYTSDAGAGFCMANQYCSDLKDCTSTADCGAGTVCAVGTCCSRNVCMPAVCANPNALLSKLARRAMLGKRADGELMTHGLEGDGQGTQASD